MPNKKNSASKTIRVAWYENNIEIIEPIVFFLEQSNFEVQKISSHEKDENSSPEDTLKRIVNELISFKPDIIIFDYRMPYFTGLEIYKELKNRKNLNEISLSYVPVFLTIWANDEFTLYELDEAGISRQAIFNKKIDPVSFAKNLKEYYDESRKKLN